MGVNVFNDFGILRTTHTCTGVGVQVELGRACIAPDDPSLRIGRAGRAVVGTL